jgi:hypothetical protein
MGVKKGRWWIKRKANERGPFQMVGAHVPSAHPTGSFKRSKSSAPL